MPPFENGQVPPATNDSWRSWLTTGVRRGPVDRRRVRGAHKGLKKMLVEGMSDGGDRPHSWQDFSAAMVRQAVDDAMRTLPGDQKQFVQLAYFGGLSNREIAEQFGFTEARVQRRLRGALDRISDYVERGRWLGRRAIGAVILWLSGRWITDATQHLVRIGAVAGAAAIILVQPGSTDQRGPGVDAQPARVFSAPAPAAVAVDRVLLQAPPAPSTSSPIQVLVPPTLRVTGTPGLHLTIALPSLPPAPVRVKLPAV